MGSLEPQVLDSKLYTNSKISNEKDTIEASCVKMDKATIVIEESNIGILKSIKNMQALTERLASIHK